MTEMAAARRNRRYLPDLELPAELAYEHDIGAALRDVDIVLISVPSHAFAALLDRIAP